MTDFQSDDRLAAILRDHAPELPVPAALREDVLASAPGTLRRLDAVMRDTQRLPVPNILSQRILAAAPHAGLWKTLWPFGPVWRPAVGLAVLAAFGIMLGATDAATFTGEVTINGALSEEVYALVFSAGEARAIEDFEWLE